MKRTKETFAEQRIYETMQDEKYPATETEKEFINNQNYKQSKLNKNGNKTNCISFIKSSNGNGQR
jgi:hypothetical protein